MLFKWNEINIENIASVMFSIIIIKIPKIIFNCNFKNVKFKKMKLNQHKRKCQNKCFQ